MEEKEATDDEWHWFMIVFGPHLLSVTALGPAAVAAEEKEATDDEWHWLMVFC